MKLTNNLKKLALKQVILEVLEKEEGFCDESLIYTLQICEKIVEAVEDLNSNLLEESE